MPIYEYDCPVCGRFEQIQKATDKALKACPMCAEKGKKSAIERVVSAAAFHLKGSGWYKTDYAAGSSAKGSSSSSAKSAEAKTDAGGTASDTAKTSSSDKTAAKETSAPKKGCGSGSCGCH